MFPPDMLIKDILDELKRDTNELRSSVAIGSSRAATIESNLRVVQERLDSLERLVGALVHGSGRSGAE